MVEAPTVLPLTDAQVDGIRDILEREGATTATAAPVGIVNCATCGHDVCKHGNGGCWGGLSCQCTAATLTPAQPDPQAQRIAALEAQVAAQAAVLATVREWSHTFGATLKPYGRWTDSYGDGVRSCKADIMGILASAPQPEPDPRIAAAVAECERTADLYVGHERTQYNEGGMDAANRIAALLEGGK